VAKTVWERYKVEIGLEESKLTRAFTPTSIEQAEDDSFSQAV
jgi:hypothetical protein